MNNAWYIVALVVVIATIALAVAAIRLRKPWLSAPSVLPVAFVVLAAPWFDGGGWLAAALVVAITALGVLAGSPLVALVLRLATPGGPQLGTHGGILVRDTTSPPPQRDKEVLRGGATIGYLERFALIGSVLAGQAAAVAIIVAIKGLGRFSELESAQARERFIIGTLGSLVWAGACAAAAVIAW